MSNSNRKFTFLNITKLISFSIVILIGIKNFAFFKNTSDLSIASIFLAIGHFCDFIQNYQQERKSISFLYLVATISFIALAVVRLLYK